ncbi:hypothetical protein AAVH_40797 [Aphelenchoides avenae]|nr:hypothetical protein AAVH_40797 [Aphelenchus avenae]
MITGKGHVIGKDVSLVKFIPSTDHEGKNYKFLAILDYVDPQGCDDPVDERHYLIQWEVDGEPETSWTHCTNFDDHLSGLQDFYSDVTRTRVAAAIKDFEEKLAKKERKCVKLAKKVKELTQQLEEARAKPARATSPQPNGDLGAGKTNEDLEDAGVDTELPRTPTPRAVSSASAGAKRGPSPDWAVPSGSSKVRRTDGDLASAGTSADARTAAWLLNASDFEMAYQFGSRATSRASSRASNASQHGKLRSLPEWVDTTGFSTKRINATTRAFRKLRADNTGMPEEQFKAKVLEQIARMEKPAQE